MRIKAQPPLLIGDIQAGTVVDEHYNCVMIGYVHEEKERVSMDFIEARALYEWLGRALQVTGDGRE